MNKSLHRSSIPKYRCEKKTALPILEWGIHSEIFNWWRWRDSNPRPSDYDSLKNILLLLYVFLLSFIINDFVILHFVLFFFVLFSYWSKIGAKKAAFSQSVGSSSVNSFSFGFFGGSIPA